MKTIVILLSLFFLVLFSSCAGVKIYSDPELSKPSAIKFHYPKPFYKQPCYQNLFSKTEFISCVHLKTFEDAASRSSAHKTQTGQPPCVESLCQELAQATQLKLSSSSSESPTKTGPALKTANPVSMISNEQQSSFFLFTTSPGDVTSMQGMCKYNFKKSIKFACYAFSQVHLKDVSGCFTGFFNCLNLLILMLIKLFD